MKEWTAEIVAKNNRWGLQLRYDGNEIFPQMLAGILNDYERKTETYGFITDKFDRLEAEKLALMAEKREVEKHLDSVIEDKKALEDEKQAFEEQADRLLIRKKELEAENERLQDAWFVDETICPDGSLKPNVSDLLSRIAELEEAQRWRVVADGELPEVYRDEDGDFIRFLVCEGDGGNPFIAMYNGINWWAGIFVPDITHWMPLPKLPEADYDIR